MIFVRNNSGSDFQDRYDGVDYVFPDGKLVECPVEAAVHIFGYGLENKTQNMIRLGWASNSTNFKEAYDRLDKFEFLQGKMMVAEPRLPDQIEPPVVKPEDEDEETDPSLRGVAVNPPANNLLSKMASMAA